MSIPSHFFTELERIEQNCQQAHEEGIPALARLATVACRDSGQSRTIARFLLGLFNGADYPFNLTALRGLDLDLHNDCLAVLRMDFYARMEVHEHLKDGGELFKQLRDRESLQ